MYDLAVLVLVALVGLWLYSIRPRKLPGVPTAPHYVPFFGHFFYLRTFGSQKFLRDMVDTAILYPKQHFAHYLPDRPPFLRLATSEAVQYILKDAFDKYIKIDSPVAKMSGVELFGDGIFAVDGEKWKFERKVASHMFATSVLKEKMEATFLEHGEIVTRILEDFSASGEYFDLQDLLKRYTMDSISKIAFGIDFGSLSNPRSEFSIAFDRIQELIILRARTPVILFKFKKFFRIGIEEEVVKCAGVLDGLVEHLIEERQKAIDASEESQSKWKDLLSQFVVMSKKRNEEMDAKHVRDVVMNFIIAGRDTTACLLTWAFYEMSQHPDMEDRIVAEIETALKGDPPSHQSIKQLEFTHNFLSEVLRMHPPLPFDAKRALVDDVLPDGTAIPAGTVMSYSPYLLNRLPWLWDNPDVFDPSRWEKEPNPSDFKFVTFNAGPRICLGKRMAYMEAKMVLAIILPKFKMTLHPKQTDEICPSLILFMRDGLKVRVTPRKR